MTDQGDHNLTSDAIVDAAQDWFLRVSAGDLSPADQSQFDRWHDADPRHRAAYEEICRLWSQLDPLEAAFAPRSQRNVGGLPSPSRRSWLAGWRLAVTSAGAAMAGLLLFLLAPEAARLPTRLMADHSTAVGEQRFVELPDGSAAYLNTDTAIDVMYSAGKRSVVLLRGEALFEVRKDARRPFDVLASDGKATAVGTAFVVRKASDSAIVSVTEGLVRVTSPDADGSSSATPASSMLVSAGESASYRRGTTPHLLGQIDVEAAAAWQRGVITIRDRPLAEALAEIGRYHRGRIVLIGDAAGQGQVTARLSLGDLDGGIDALVATQGLSITRVTPWLMLVR